MKAKPINKPKTELLCRYMSGSFQNHELNYPIHEKETLALIRMLRKHQIYLMHQEFLVKIDSTYVVGFKNLNIKESYKQKRLIKLQIDLNHYDYKIVHIAGNKNVLADILSREWSISS